MPGGCRVSLHQRWIEPAAERFLQSVCAVLLTGPSDAGIGTDQYRTPCIDGDATYPLRAGCNELRSLPLGRGVEKNAHAILHDIVERDAIGRGTDIAATDRLVADQPSDIVSSDPRS